jgi:tripartite-type tricarboxylate transporter receptor subunit TctC
MLSSLPLRSLARALRAPALALVVAIVPLAAQAQAFPARPVRILVPFAPGGLVDTYARALQPKLAEGLGQPVVIENRAGAGGTLAEAALAKSAPDGYTVMMSGDSVPANPHLYGSLGYDLFRDLLPVSQLAQVPLALVTPAALAPATLEEFVRFVRGRPGGVTYASPGTGTSNHFAAELFRARAGLEFVHVPYKGGGPAMTDLVAGQVQALFTSVFLAAPQVKAGKIKALAVGGTRRSALLPDVPTFAEAGFAGFRAASWSGLFAPAGTPAPIVQRLHAEFVAALRSPEVENRFRELGTEVIGSGPADFAAVLRREHDELGKLIRDLRITVN